MLTFAAPRSTLYMVTHSSCSTPSYNVWHSALQSESTSGGATCFDRCSECALLGSCLCAWENLLVERRATTSFATATRPRPRPCGRRLQRTQSSYHISPAALRVATSFSCRFAKSFKAMIASAGGTCALKTQHVPPDLQLAWIVSTLFASRQSH